MQLFDNYREHFCKLGLNDNQILQALRSILELGAAAKNLNDLTKVSEAVAEIGMTKEDYCQFISDNAGFIYSDYSRKIQETIDAVVQKFGRDEAIQQIKEHPDWIRLGFS